MIMYERNEKGFISYTPVDLTQREVISQLTKATGTKIKSCERLRGVWPTKFVIWYGDKGVGTDNPRFHGVNFERRGNGTRFIAR